VEILHIKLARDSDNWPPFDNEEVQAENIGHHTYRITAPPAFARRLAVGDIVRTRHFGESQVAWIEEVIEHSGHSTLRVIVRKNADEKAVMALLEELDLVALSTPLLGLFAIDIPAERAYPSVRDRLLGSQAAGDIEFEEAALSVAHDYLKR
jgi:hypothetical protein